MAIAQDPVPGTFKAELGLQRDFVSPGEESLLAFTWTYQQLDRISQLFFSQYGLTAAQFNVLMILWDYRDRTLHQHEIADLLLVGRASFGNVLDGLVRRGLAVREQDTQDRRANQVRLSSPGRQLLERVKKRYYALFPALWQHISAAEQGRLREILAKLRGNLASLQSQLTPEVERLAQEAVL